MGGEDRRRREREESERRSVRGRKRWTTYRGLGDANEAKVLVR